MTVQSTDAPVACAGVTELMVARGEADAYAAPNYPLPVVISAGGSWVTDPAGVSYLDMLAGYSALNFGHRQPDLIAAAQRQLDRMTLTSRDTYGSTIRIAPPLNTSVEDLNWGLNRLVDELAVTP